MSKRLHMIYVEVFFHFYGLFYHYQNTKSKYYISNTLTLKSNIHFYEKKNVLDNFMCPDSDRYFILFLYTDGNPCSTGVPHKVNDDAVTCSQRRCPYGYACVGRRNMFAVCCPIGHGK